MHQSVNIELTARTTMDVVYSNKSRVSTSWNKDLQGPNVLSTRKDWAQ